MATPNIFINVISTPQENWQWNITVLGSDDFFGAEHTSSAAHNAEVSYDFYAASGTYTLDLLHKFGTNRGIYTIQIDGVTVGTVDGYNASANIAGLSSVTGIAIAATGVHRLRLLMATKNAGSSGYQGFLHGITFKRTGA